MQDSPRSEQHASGSSVDALSSSPDPIQHMPLLQFIELRPAPSPEPGVHSVTMELGPNVANMAGAPHGGALATLIDHTGGHAASALLGRGGPTVDLHVRYLTTPRGSTRVRADARVIREGRSLIIVSVDVRDEQERLVAMGSLTVAARPGRPEPSPD